MAATRNDVARVAGVSSATVSYVLNNGPRPVAVDTRNRVLRAIQELGYRPNPLARNLRLQRTSTIGLLVPDIHNPYFADVARGVEDCAYEHGFRVLLCHSRFDLGRELEYIDVLKTERAAGVIWIPATTDEMPAAKLVESGMPVVALDRHIESVPMTRVMADNAGGGRMATEHLIALGHRRIGCIVRPGQLGHAQDRVRGYLQALEKHGLPSDETLMAPGGFHLEQGWHATQSLLNLPDRPTAIFAYNDMNAMAAMRCVSERGLRVPDDISIVGFDDIPLSAYTCPSLTTVEQPKLDMGYRGARHLLDQIAGTAQTSQAETLLEVRLIVRESSGPVPQGRA